jgi:hypothetical protein
VLQRHNLIGAYSNDPVAAIATLHSEVATDPQAWDQLFALAEMSFRQARLDGSASRYMAAAIYAYAFLFPDDASGRPDPYDPRFRQACDIYNLALAAALPLAEDGEVNLASGRYTLPFGTVDIAVQQDSLQWGGRKVISLKPTGSLRVTGLKNQYRVPGIGASMAARLALPTGQQPGFQIAPRLRVPATLLLRIGSPRRQLASGQMVGTMALFKLLDTRSVTLGDQRVPLEYDQTAARAVGLVETAIWDTELGGFLRGTRLDATQPQLVSFEPHRPGRRPVVLVHGTASSPFRWADMINDLVQDQDIRDHYEFWVFTYQSGNPIPYSALLLRNALQQAIDSLGGETADPALGHIVLIGHSQGGLLAKMLVIDPGTRLWDQFSRRPLNQLKLRPESRDLIQRSLFPIRMKQVDRVIFIATPQRGSYLAALSILHLVGRLVTLPLSVVMASADVMSGNKDALQFDPSTIELGSVYGMTPGNPFIKALADIPVALGVHVNSIIPVQGDGPVALGDDGVVKYASAHIDGAESELVIQSSHSAQSNPVTIEEVRRLLLSQASAF